MADQMMGGWWCSCGAHTGEIGGAARVEVDGCPFCGSHRRLRHEVRVVHPGQLIAQMEWGTPSYLYSGGGESVVVGRQRFARHRKAAMSPSEQEAAANAVVLPEGGADEEWALHYHLTLYGEESIVQTVERMEAVRAVLETKGGEVEVRRCTNVECFTRFFGRRRGWGDRRFLQRREHGRRRPAASNGDNGDVAS